MSMQDVDWHEVEQVENDLYRHYVDFLQGKIETRNQDPESAEVEEPAISETMRETFNEYYRAVVRPRIALTRKAIFYAVAQEIAALRQHRHS